MYILLSAISLLEAGLEGAGAHNLIAIAQNEDGSSRIHVLGLRVLQIAAPFFVKLETELA
jgi:hypothetical protein